MTNLNAIISGTGCNQIFIASGNGGANFQNSGFVGTAFDTGKAPITTSLGKMSFVSELGTTPHINGNGHSSGRGR